jgi:hypothetical protein
MYEGEKVCGGIQAFGGSGGKIFQVVLTDYDVFLRIESFCPEIVPD